MMEGTRTPGEEGTIGRLEGRGGEEMTMRGSEIEDGKGLGKSGEERSRDLRIK
jgi:hypothetical protein